MTRTHRLVVGLLVAAWVLAPGLAAAQRARGVQRGAGGAGGGQGLGAAAAVTPAQLEKWFDSYVLLQAQDTLKLADTQFPRFLGKLRALQETRRRNMQARRQALAALARLARTQPFDEAQARERLKALTDIEVRAHGELRKAYEGVDEVLDALQQVRFRLLEETVERKKVELLMQARRAAADR